MQVTIDDLKLYLSITNTGSGGDLTVWNENDGDLAYNDTSQDGILQILLDGAVAFVEHYCGRIFGLTTVTEYINGNAQNKIILKQFPVNSITSFQYNSGTKTAESFTTIDPDNYWLSSGSGVIDLAFLLARGFKNYKIVYSAGYSEDPADVKTAVLKLAANYYTVRGADGIKRETVSGDTIEYGMSQLGMPEDVALILNGYKNVNVV